MFVNITVHETYKNNFGCKEKCFQEKKYVNSTNSEKAQMVELSVPQAVTISFGSIQCSIASK